LTGKLASFAPRDPFDRQETPMPASPLHKLARLIVLASLIVGTAQAADTSAPAVNDPLAAARTQIAAKRWPEAVAELKRINATDNADWQNLMGYSLRKSQPPDYAGAERHYDEALRINPQHRGALEYSGELYLLTGNLPRAEARLAALNKACFLPCEEYTDLKRSVEAYKAKDPAKR
jgi:tetratricopeptide (TPR) repeat protein